MNGRRHAPGARESAPGLRLRPRRGLALALPPPPPLPIHHLSGITRGVTGGMDTAVRTKPGERKASAPNCARCAGRTLRPPPPGPPQAPPAPSCITRGLQRRPSRPGAPGPELLLITARGWTRWEPAAEPRVETEGVSPGTRLGELPGQACGFKWVCV